MADKAIVEPGPDKPEVGKENQEKPQVQTTNISLGNVEVLKIKLLAEIRDIVKEQLTCSQMILEEIRGK
jgi:hypothetical protein